MKTSADKSSTTTSTPATKAASRPFFSKAGGGDYFTPAVQMKMAVSKPGDKLEHEAAKVSAPEKRDVATPKIQPATAVAGNQMSASSGFVVLSSNTFNPSEKVRDEIEAQGSKGLDVRVMVKGLTGEGLVKIKVDKSKNYDSIGKGSMPLLNAWGEQLGGLYINFRVVNSQVSGGYASLNPGGGNTNDWLKAVQQNSVLLGGLGLKVGSLPTSVNKFDNGKLTLGVTNLKVEIGGFLDSRLNLSIENSNKPKIDATADITVKGIAKGQLIVDNTKDSLTGKVSLAIEYQSFSGSADVAYNADGTVDIGGKASYNADKLSGEIQFVATDLNVANSFAKNAISAAGGKENVQNAAAPAPVPAPKSNQKQRALAATGQLGFNLTTWFAGTVNVVVDGNGAITVIGKIVPPAEIELFKQRDWDKQLVKFEAKAYYGIPLVGNLNLFANISLHALAKLGPAKLYNIEILGTYSTDPEIQKNIQISGSLNISAYAGLRLRAEGGAGIEIIAHDIKFGIGLNADVGVKAYADARPTIGYRDPGIFYVSGTLEMVAQPMLGLGGDFFIELDSPWWSPAPDEKWMWPLFSKEWPLTDPIGLSATVKDYVLGSGVAPEIELKKPEFDPSKFMTSMVDKTLPEKTGGPGAGQGTFKEDGSVPKPTVPPKKAAPKKADVKQGKKGSPTSSGKSRNPDKNAATAQDANKTLKSSLEGLKNKAPYSKVELDKALDAIKGKVKGITFSVQAQGEKWVVTPGGGGKKKSSGRIEVAIKKDKGGKNEGQIGKVVKFTAVKESHRLWIVQHGTNAVVMMASAERPLTEQLNDYETLALQLQDKEKQSKVIGLIGTARQALIELDTKADKFAGDITKPETKPEQIATEDNAIKSSEDRLVATVKQIGELLSSPENPMKSAPNIGNIERHGLQNKRIRTGPQILRTESEHILPFATGRSLWQALALYLPERGWPEDNQQTTIVIYERAARIKTPQDNEVSAQFSDAVGSLNIPAKLKVQKARYEQGDKNALSEGREILGTILGPLHKAKSDAVVRTNKAISQENQEKENGFTRENRERRAIPPNVEPPIPAQSDVAAAAERQYNDVLSLVKKEWLSHEKVVTRVNRIMMRD